MQTRQSVKNICAGDTVQSVFLLTAASSLQSRNGPYWKVELRDASGKINGNIWAPESAEYTSLPVGKMVKVQAQATSFRDQVQLTVKRVRELAAEEEAALDIADFLPASPFPVAYMWDRLMTLIDKECQHAPWRVFILGALNDTDIKTGFCSSPAAKSMHHAYAAGLLEHTLSVAGLVMRLADHYPFVDRQCLLAGALFHDLGKVWEFSGGIANDYTDAGRLVGHMELALERLAPYWENSGLHPELIQHFRHLVLSHHGSYEFGSARLPQTPEAFLLHFADNIDAKMNQCEAPFLTWEEGQSRWSAWLPALERQLYYPYRTPCDGDMQSVLRPCKNGRGAASSGAASTASAAASGSLRATPEAAPALSVPAAEGAAPAAAATSAAAAFTGLASFASPASAASTAAAAPAVAGGAAEFEPWDAGEDLIPASLSDGDCVYVENEYAADLPEPPEYDGLDFPNDATAAQFVNDAVVAQFVNDTVDFAHIPPAAESESTRVTKAAQVSALTGTPGASGMTATANTERTAEQDFFAWADMAQPSPQSDLQTITDAAAPLTSVAKTATAAAATAADAETDIFMELALQQRADESSPQERASFAAAPAPGAEAKVPLDMFASLPGFPLGSSAAVSSDALPDASPDVSFDASPDASFGTSLGGQIPSPAPKKRRSKAAKTGTSAPSGVTVQSEVSAQSEVFVQPEAFVQTGITSHAADSGEDSAGTATLIPSDPSAVSDVDATSNDAPNAADSTAQAGGKKASSRKKPKEGLCLSLLKV